MRCDKYSNIQKKIKQSFDFQKVGPGGGVEAGAEFAADAIGVVAGALGGEPQDIFAGGVDQVHDLGDAVVTVAGLLIEVEQGGLNGVGLHDVGDGHTGPFIFKTIAEDHPQGAQGGGDNLLSAVGGDIEPDAGVREVLRQVIPEAVGLDENAH